MTLLVRRELPPLEKPHRRGEAAKPEWHRLVALITNSELVTVAAFCALGLLVTAMWCVVFPILG
jgi:hypothetical protein